MTAVAAADYLDAQAAREGRNVTAIRIERLPLGDLQANCYVVVGPDNHAAIIDPGDEPQRVFALLDTMPGLRVDAVILTHGHFDHVGASDEVADDVHGFVYAHEREAAALAGKHGTGGREFGMEVPVPLIDFRVTDGAIIEAGSMSFEVIHTPGHSPGSMCLLLRDAETGAQHLFSGDTLFAGSIGRTDFPGGDDIAMDESLERIAKLSPETHVHSGHGPSTTLANESAANPFWPGS